MDYLIRLEGHPDATAVDKRNIESDMELVRAELVADRPDGSDFYGFRAGLTERVLVDLRRDIECPETLEDK